MKATKVYYERCVNLGNYENEKIGIEIELSDDLYTVTDAVQFARARIDKLTGRNKSDEDRLREKFEAILQNSGRHYYNDVTEAKKWISEHPEPEDDLPF